jgi:hypothetical protein
MSEHMFFYLGLSLISIHEMDAIRCKEWRIFPGLSLLNDDWGYRVFMLAHIPLYYFIFERVGGDGDNENFIHGMNIFFMVHLGLHLLFLMHKKNEFKDWLSWLLITGAALFGYIDILLK